MIMANIEKVNYGYIKKWEGGKSKDPNDPASRFPVPDGTGYHTNMGITWQSFHAHFPNLKPIDFYAMPENLWLQIYKDGYWNAVRADEIKGQIIAEFMADWAWGSGAYYPIKTLQALLSANGYTCAIDGLIGKVTIGQLNSMITVKGERAVFDMLFTQRTGFLQRLSGFARYGIGWINRIKDFRAYAYSIL